MTVEVEIVCVGNELLIGKVVNTNASWLGKRATSLGARVKRITVCADDVEEMAQVYHEALARKPHLIISTGGLGPTFDDKTLQGIAKALNRKLVVNEKALFMVKEKYTHIAETRNIPEEKMTASRVKMATIPEDAEPLKNPVGTAPGIRINLDSTTVIVLPGVPSEMEAIFEEAVTPMLRLAAGNVSFYEKSIFANNIMESVLAPLIDIVMHDNPLVYIKSHPKGRESKPHMELHLSTSGKPEENPDEKLERAATKLAKLIREAGGEIVSL